MTAIASHWTAHPALRLLPTFYTVENAQRIGGASLPSTSVRSCRLHPRPLRFAAASARRRSYSATSSERKKSLNYEDAEEEDDTSKEDDAFEALFKQLEEDLANDDPNHELLDDEINEEDLDNLAKELTEAFGDANDDEESIEDEMPSSENLHIENELSDEISQPKIRNWQLRRLARVLKVGRRKVGIKGLAVELGLERSYILKVLRNPPPDLLLMAASLPDEPIKVRPSERQVEPIEDPPSIIDDTDHAIKSDPPKKLPIHEMKDRWSSQKRLKKVHVATLEKVYYRTNRPTNAMISSIVHVTNLPWKTVVKWFEDKRLEDGVPERQYLSKARVPYRRST